LSAVLCADVASAEFRLARHSAKITASLVGRRASGEVSFRIRAASSCARSSRTSARASGRSQRLSTVAATEDHLPGLASRDSAGTNGASPAVLWRFVCRVGKPLSVSSAAAATSGSAARQDRARGKQVPLELSTGAAIGALSLTVRVREGTGHTLSSGLGGSARGGKRLGARAVVDSGPPVEVSRGGGARDGCRTGPSPVASDEYSAPKRATRRRKAAPRAASAFPAGSVTLRSTAQSSYISSGISRNTRLLHSTTIT
jgi:hypothetical protein